MKSETPLGSSAGDAHACALLTGDNVKCWGFNDYGQVGAGGTRFQLTPASVYGLTGATSITAGYHHTCALLTGGTAKCWGHNSYGQLGDGTLALSQSTPVSVAGLTGATAIAVGGYYSCALLTAGTVMCWGRNSHGQLGDGTISDWRTPVTVAGLTGATAIALGYDFSCALLIGGTVECWGRNVDGQLGDGTTTDRWTPAPVAGLTGATSITVGESHACALLTDGSVNCWGRNNDGQSGDGTTTASQLTPVRVAGLTGATAVTAGRSHTCALLADGTLECWGDNYHGQLGDGTNYNARLTPVSVAGVTGVSAITGGRSYYTCALLMDGAVKCWGFNALGQLGDGTTTDRSTPVSVTGL